MRIFCLFFLIFSCVNIYAQSSSGLFYNDTLKSDYRIGGSLDSIDVMFGFQSTTLSGGGWNYQNNYIDPLFFFKLKNGQRFLAFQDWQRVKFTGLPHIGFAYIFGSQGNQVVQAEYQQVFSKSVLNLSYDKNRSTNFLRNGEFDHNTIQLQFQRQGSIYSTELKGTYESSNVHQNGGLLIDSLAEEFDLVFLPIRKENAKTKTQRSKLIWNNFLNLSGDSTQHKGFLTNHTLEIKKYEYQESDTLVGLYSIINYDSLETFDQHQFSKAGNGVGVYFKISNHFFKTTYNLDFWNFQNLGNYYDTLEHNLKFQYTYLSDKFRLENYGEVNIAGANHGWENSLKLNTHFQKINVAAKLLIENQLPDVYQRYAYGNNFNFFMLNPEKQFRQFLAVEIEPNLKPINLKLGYRQSYVKENYFLINNNWNNDTLQNVFLQTFSLSVPLKWKGVCFNPNYLFSTTSKGLEIIPQHQFLARLSISGGVFEAKKLKVYSGVDFSIASKVRIITYNPLLSIFDYTNNQIYNSSFMNLHWFGGFQIDQFKFFTRVENISSFWESKVNNTYKGFPPAALQFRIGITWDFFN